MYKYSISFDVARDFFFFFKVIYTNCLLHNFNLSMQKGFFPDELKVAKVTPVYKKNDETNLGNYKPISVLPCFSKILERIIYNRLYKHLNSDNILYEK